MLLACVITGRNSNPLTKVSNISGSEKNCTVKGLKSEKIVKFPLCFTCNCMNKVCTVRVDKGAAVWGTTDGPLYYLKTRVIQMRSPNFRPSGPKKNI